MRMETRRNGNSSMYFSARTGVHASHFDWRGRENYYAKASQALYTTRIAVFSESLSGRLGTQEPQAYHVHAPVVNTALVSLTVLGVVLV